MQQLFRAEFLKFKVPKRYPDKYTSNKINKQKKQQINIFFDIIQHKCQGRCLFEFILVIFIILSYFLKESYKGMNKLKKN